VGGLGRSTRVVCCAQVTENAPAGTLLADGVASVTVRVGVMRTPARPRKPLKLRCCSSSAPASHSGSPIGPSCVPIVAVAFENATWPKSASGRISHASLPAHAEGASTIHSAEEASISARRLVVWKRPPVVRSRIRSVTSWPATVTEASIRSPGRTRIFRLTGAAGSSSYQLRYRAAPARVQSASVPTCSSACECSL
jgi:hypothetical protein